MNNYRITKMIKILKLYLSVPYTKLERELNTITLQFLQRDLEIKFHNENTQKRLFQFRVTTTLQMLINIGYVINSSVIYSNYQNVLFRALLACWLFLCLFIQRMFGKYENILTNTLVYVNSVFNVVLFVNFTLTVSKAQQNLDQIIQLTMMSGLSQALFAITFAFIQSNYLLQSLTLFTYFFVIMGAFDSFSNYRLWTHYLLMLFICYLLRSNEKAARLNFLQTYKSNCNLDACKRIYDETVPNSIVILEPGVSESQVLNSINSQREKEQLAQDLNQINLVYYNKSASLHFQTLEEDQIINQLNEIEIITPTIALNEANQQERLLDAIQKHQHTSVAEQKFSKTGNSDYQIINARRETINCRRFSAGKQYYYDVEIVGCIWEGRNCVMLILNDTTDRALRIQYLQELDQYKDTLLAAVSHDLKTPLIALLVLVNIIKSTTEKKTNLNQQEISELNKNLDDILSNQQILLTMINDLIDYSQLKKQGLRLNFTQFCLNQCIEKILAMFRRQIEMKKLSFQIIGLEDQIEMYTDETRLSQILFNLINNAIKFTFQGSIILSVSQQLQQGDVKVIRFTVKDTGIGIPNHIQAKLFKAYSTHNLGNCNHQGVGLGLVISKKMVGLLGPKEYIEMMSKEGDGSTFSFDLYMNAVYRALDQQDIPILDSLPLKQIPFIPVQSQSFNVRKHQSLTEISRSLQELRILLVDDTVFNLIVLRQQLTKLLQFKELDEAQNGKEAVEMVHKKYYDIIFMDVMMPIMDGYRATNAIRDFEKSSCPPRRSLIVILSAFHTHEDLENAAKAGADEQLEKPLKLNDIKQLLLKYKFL